MTLSFYSNGLGLQVREVSMKIIKLDKIKRKSRLTHSEYRNDYHLMFATKSYNPWLNPLLIIRIRILFREKAEELNLKLYLVNGFKNHIHVLLSIPPTITISNTVRHLKGYSSRVLGKKKFWKEGYLIQSIGEKDFSLAFSNIQNQAKYHRNRSAQNEIREFLKSA